MMERNRATPMTTMMTTTMTMMTKAQKATMTIRISKRIKSQTYCLKCGRATRLMKNTSNWGSAWIFLSEATTENSKMLLFLRAYRNNSMTIYKRLQNCWMNSTKRTSESLKRWTQFCFESWRAISEWLTKEFWSLHLLRLPPKSSLLKTTFLIQKIMMRTINKVKIMTVMTTMMMRMTTSMVNMMLLITRQIMLITRTRRRGILRNISNRKKMSNTHRNKSKNKRIIK